MGKFGVSVFTQEKKGHNGDAKEAVAFALLAYYTLMGIPNNLCSATGAKYPAVLGKISF
jgi:anhydro-N-acetylmuramic acid kinase